MGDVYTGSRPPSHCRQGHRLGPNRVVVSFARCDGDTATGGGHYQGRCRECGDRIYGDGHTDDTKLSTPPGPAL